MSAARASTKAKPKAPRYDRNRPPQELAVDDWQRALRRQFGREQDFVMENLGDELVFSDFRVSNPQIGTTYRVSIRGSRPGENRCSCPDFASNELGTCKHIEFALAAVEKRRGAKMALRRGYRPPFSEIVLHHGSPREIRLRPGGDMPEALLSSARALFRADEDWHLPPSCYADLDRFILAARTAGHDLRCADEALDHLAGCRDAVRRQGLIDREFPAGAASPALARLIKVPLYPYQAEGALFAVRAGRCLIGDEMGLGKTVQAIAATEILARLCGVERVLVVCPTSLKHQWQREIARFTGREARVVGGLRAARIKDFAADDFCKITNFEKLRLDLDLIQHWAPDLVIVDEAQRIKNWNTIAARALKRIASPYAIVLTGTPLENKLEELISIVQFVDQFRLGPTWRLLYAHQERDETGRVVGYRDLDRIGESLAPIMIRRRKAEVLTQLPERTEQTIYVPMTAEQLRHHRENADIVARIVNRWKRTHFLSDADQRRLTCALQNMRMSCNSSYLLDPAGDHGVKADELAALLEEALARAGEKAVVFSQWQRTHEIVARRLDALGIGYVMFNGSVPGDRRGALIDRFRDDPDCRVFLSTDAGSVGLNLQHAALLVNMDLPWNPAVLEQRNGRIYRLGQQKRVQIINFVSEGTIEESMLSVLAFKRSLAAGILDGGAGEVTLDGTRLTSFMREVEKVTGAMADVEAIAVDEELPATGGVAVEGSAETAVAITDDAAVAAAATPSALQAGAVETAVPGPQATPVPAAAGDPWAPLLDFGMQFLGALAAGGRGETSHPWIERDPTSGRGTLRIPLPPPAVSERLADTLAQLAAALRQR